MAVTQQDFDSVKAELLVANTAVGSLTSGLALVTEKLEKLTGDKLSDQVVRLVDPGAIWHCELWSAWARTDSGAALTAVLNDQLTGCQGKTMILEMFVDIILPLLVDTTLVVPPRVLTSFRDKVFLASFGRDMPKEKAVQLKFHLASTRIPSDLRKALAAVAAPKE